MKKVVLIFFIMVSVLLYTADEKSSVFDFNEDNHNIKKENVIKIIKSYITLSKEESERISSKENNRWYEVSFGNPPTPYDYFLLIPIEGKIILLYCRDKDGEVKLADIAGEKDSVLYINLAKFEIDINKDTIHIWSQQPFRNLNWDSYIQWDGKKLKVTKSKSSDPTSDYYDELEKMVKKGNVDSVIELINNGEEVMYPANYAGFHSLPRPILLLANKKSLEKYKAKDKKRALAILEACVNYNTYVYIGCELTEVSVDSFKEKDENRLTKDEFAEIFNNYGFFLAENGRYKDAEEILKKVSIVMPERKPVYLNLGDVYWELNMIKEGKESYRKYVELMAANKGKIPKRVFERCK